MEATQSLLACVSTLIHYRNHIVNNGDSTGEDGTPALYALLYRPTGIAYDQSTKRLYFSESLAHRIRYITVLDGNIYHYIGSRNKTAGDITGLTFANDTAVLKNPMGIDIANGDLYIAGNCNFAF
jgi:hypothetical protein